MLSVSAAQSSVSIFHKWRSQVNLEQVPSNLVIEMYLYLISYNVKDKRYGKFTPGEQRGFGYRMAPSGKWMPKVCYSLPWLVFWLSSCISETPLGYLLMPAIAKDELHPLSLGDRIVGWRLVWWGGGYRHNPPKHSMHSVHTYLGRACSSLGTMLGTLYETWDGVFSRWVGGSFSNYEYVSFLFKIIGV